MYKHLFTTLAAGAVTSLAVLTIGTAASAGPPKLSEADFEKAKTLYFQRCAGCHGVLRKGATGKNLEPKNTMKLGTEKLAKIIKIGTDGVMNPFNDIFDDATIKLLAEYIQIEPPVPPEMTLATSHTGGSGHVRTPSR